MTEQELLDKGYEDVVFFRNYGYDGCIIGITTNNRAVYSFEKMVQWLHDKHNMTEEDAVEWIEYNTLKALPYVENAPIVAYTECDLRL